MDAGHSFEITLFKGILRLVENMNTNSFERVENKKFVHLILEKCDPKLIQYEIDMNILRNIILTNTPSGDLLCEEPSEFSPEPFQHVLECFDDLDEEEKIIIGNAPQSEEEFLKSKGLDPKLHRILRFDVQSCVVQLFENATK
jgi:hypothetical protein